MGMFGSMHVNMCTVRSTLMSIAASCGSYVEYIDMSGLEAEIKFSPEKPLTDGLSQPRITSDPSLARRAVSAFR